MIGKKCYIKRLVVNAGMDKYIPGTIIDETENDYYVRVWYGFEFIKKENIILEKTTC